MKLTALHPSTSKSRTKTPRKNYDSKLLNVNPYNKDLLNSTQELQSQTNQPTHQSTDVYPLYNYNNNLRIIVNKKYDLIQGASRVTNVLLLNIHFKNVRFPWRTLYIVTDTLQTSHKVDYIDIVFCIRNFIQHCFIYTIITLFYTTVNVIPYIRFITTLY